MGSSDGDKAPVLLEQTGWSHLGWAGLETRASPGSKTHTAVFLVPAGGPVPWAHEGMNAAALEAVP